MELNSHNIEYLYMLKIFELFKFQNVDDLPRTGNFRYNYLLGMAMLYTMLQLLSGLMIYKIVEIGSFIAPVAVFTTPLTYCLSNVTTEVYGYKVGRNMMWWFLFMSTIFTLMSTLMIHIPSPASFKHQVSFNLIFGSMPRVYLAGILGTLYGLSFNNYVVSKLKLIMDGKRYWLRSILSTCGGEIVYNLIAYPIMFLGRVPLDQLLHIFICVTLFKISTTAFFLLPECWLANFLKYREKINVFDDKNSYSIFGFSFFSDKSKKPNLELVK